VQRLGWLRVDSAGDSVADAGLVDLADNVTDAGFDALADAVSEDVLFADGDTHADADPHADTNAHADTYATSC